MKNYDVVVVGAGNGGLAAASVLAKNGKKVLVLEKHNLPGGCATSFNRGRFEFEATLHEFCSMGDGKGEGCEGTVRKLMNFLDLNVEWVASEEAFASISTDPKNGFNVRMPVGVNAFINEMEKAVPGSRESMTTLFEVSKMLNDAINWLGKYNNEPEGLAKVVMLLKWKDLMKLVPQPVDEVLRKIGLPDKAREIYESYWDYIGCDSTKTSFAVYAYMTYTYITQKPYLAKHRSHEISLAYDKCIRDNGSDIWYNSEVSEIKVENGQVKGVQIKNGPFIACNRVMCNLMPHVAFDRLIDHKEVPTREKKLMNARKLGFSCSTVYLGLDIPYEELGFKAYDTFIRKTGDTLKQVESMNSLDKNDCVTITVLNDAIPDCSPKGTCMLSLSKFYTENVFENVKEEDYFKVKDKIANDCIDLFEQSTGCKIRDHIEEIEVATPATYAKYLGTPFGDVYGYSIANWDGMFPRVQSGHKLDYTIKGLRFCGGHGTQMDGFSQSMLSGQEQARYMLEDMRKEK